jgi:hypothetical protein
LDWLVDDDDAVDTDDSDEVDLVVIPLLLDSVVAEVDPVVVG